MAIAKRSIKLNHPPNDSAYGTDSMPTPENQLRRERMIQFLCNWKIKFKIWNKIFKTRISWRKNRTWQCIESIETGLEKWCGAGSFLNTTTSLYCWWLVVSLSMHERYSERKGNPIFLFSLHCQRKEFK